MCNYYIKIVALIFLNYKHPMKNWTYFPFIDVLNKGSINITPHLLSFQIILHYITPIRLIFSIWTLTNRRESTLLLLIVIKILYISTRDNKNMGSIYPKLRETHREKVVWMILISASKINSGQTKERSQIQTINPYCRG
jgi:hypothetical protein